MHLTFAPRTLLAISATSLLLLLHSSPSQAALVLYEGFDYGGSNILLQNVNGTPLGLAGGGYNHTTGNYLASGLTFSNLQVSGGLASVSATSSWRVPSKQLATGTLSGTIYGSFLFQQTGSVDNRDVNMVAFGPDGVNDNGNTVAFLTDSYSSGPTDSAASIRASGTNYIANGTQPPPAAGGAVNLALFEITNVGAVDGTQQVTLWLLNSTQFDYFKAGEQGLTTAELNGAGIGSGATDVLDRVTLSIDGSGGYISLTNDSFLNLGVLQSTASFDEIRLSNLNLNEVTPVPEPGSVILLGLAGMALVFNRRRRSL